jgi:hypothetical protein
MCVASKQAGGNAPKNERKFPVIEFLLLTLALAQVPQSLTAKWNF